MRNKLAHILALAVLGVAMPTLADAMTPSFVVKCMRTAGPAVGSKYGTFYFYLRDGVVKGFVCGLPGRPCQIVSQDSKTVVFDTPGEAPDRLTIDLRSGTVQQKNSVGIETSYSCRQIPYQE